MVRLSQRLLPLPFLAMLLLAQAAGIAEERKDREFQECPECPVMVGLPAGGFVMGSPPNESGRFKNEGPQHFVAIKAFALGKYDVTSEEFLTFLKDTGYQPGGVQRHARHAMAIPRPRQGVSPVQCRAAPLARRLSGPARCRALLGVA